MYRFTARGVSLSPLFAWVLPTLVWFRKAAYSILVLLMSTAVRCVYHRLTEPSCVSVVQGVFPGDVDASSCSYRIHSRNDEPYIHLEIVKVASPGASAMRRCIGCVLLCSVGDVARPAADNVALLSSLPSDSTEQSTCM